MSMSCRVMAAVAACLTVSAPGAFAAPGDYIGSEVIVGTGGSSSGDGPAVARTPDGPFVVAWGIYGAGVRARVFDAGMSDQPEIVVDTASSSSGPVVGVDAAGNFAIAWCEFSTVWVRRYDSTGTSLSEASSVASGQSWDPALAMNADGTYVLAWTNTGDGEGQGISAQRYDASGAALGVPIAVNSTTAGSQMDPAIGADGSGGFVVTWVGPDGDSVGVFAQRFDASGAAVGGEIALSSSATGIQWLPDIAVASDGRFAVTWCDQPTLNDQCAIMARRFDATGSPVGPEWQVNGGHDAYWGSRIGGAPDGSFTVTWTQTLAVPPYRTVFAQRFDAVGTALGSVMVVDTTVDALPWQPIVAADADGDQVIAWASERNGISVVLARRVVGPEDVDLTVISSDSQDPAIEGLPFDYAVSVGNLHPTSAPGFGTATGVAVSATLPIGASLLGTGGAGWSCVQNANVECSYSSPVAAATDAADLTLTVSAQAGTAELTVSVAGDQYESDTGDNSATVTTTVAAADLSPDAFAFVDQVDVPLTTEITSAPITIAGINTEAVVSVSNGLYSVNGGAFTASAGAVVSGDQVQVRHTSAATLGTATASVLTVGDVSDAFTSTTVSEDTTPDAFQFNDVTGVKPRASVTSNTITVTGTNAPATIDVAGGDARYSINGGPWQSSSGSVVDGDAVALRVTAPSTRGATIYVLATIGGASDTWSVTTR